MTTNHDLVAPAPEPAGPGTALAGWRGYVVAGGCLALALAARRAMDPLWGERLPYVSFFLTQLLLVRFAGVGPLLLASLAGLALGDWFFVAPRGSLLIAGRLNQVNACFFLLSSAVLVLLSLRAQHALARERASQEELRRHTQEVSRLAAIVESSEDAIIGKRLDGTIVSWNAAAERLYGYSAAEIIGQSISLLIPADCQGELSPLLERVSGGERIDHFESVRKARSGRLIPVSLTISPFRDRAGKIVGASTIARDITERKLAEVERERLVRELREALASVKTLTGLLPICAHCKKIRDDQGYWNQIEMYIRARSDAKFTHGICPECARRYYPELYPARASQRGAGLPPGDQGTAAAEVAPPPGAAA